MKLARKGQQGSFLHHNMTHWQSAKVKLKKYNLGLNHYYHAPQVPHSFRYHSSNQVQEHHMIDNVSSSTRHLGQGTVLSQVLQLQHIDLHQHPTASVPPEKKKELCKKLAERSWMKRRLLTLFLLSPYRLFYF